MSKLKEFVVQQARPLPVIVLADTSGSMSDAGKIDALNGALKEMVASFAAESRVQADIQIGLITFGGDEALLHQPVMSAGEIEQIADLAAFGRTPMGSAFDLALKLIEDRNTIPSRAYRPVVIVLSDGFPTDDWEDAFARFSQSERAAKCSRYAMGIGPDADIEMLKRFVNDPESPVFRADQARDIVRFFRAVTMTVTSRTRSTSPDAPLALVEIPDIDDLDLDL